MRNSNTQSIKEVIEELINAYKLRGKLNEVRLQHSWEELMGSAVNKRTKEIYLRDKKLFIRLTSAPLKEELFYSSEKIKKMLNELLEGEYIEEVKFL
ncbi:MAG TPA: DUF721 domain-containing protein [Bacteroidia bacterium]|nr:DUF721 domain-containing protein [Bacteroidia bacterium]